MEADLIKKRLDEVGIPFETVLDLKHCNPMLMWAKLKDDDRNALGLACVIRVPVHRDSLPPSRSGVIPVTRKGFVDISDEVKKKYLNAADPELVREWNSRAADWWIDEGSDDQEKLYHLVKAGRHFESDRLLIRNAKKFLTHYNKDLLDIVKAMDAPSKTPQSSWNVRGKLAIYCQDVKYAETCAEKLKEIDSIDGDILTAEVKYIKGNYEDALEDANTLYAETKSARVAILKGRSLFALEEYDSADKVLVDTLKDFSVTGDISRIDEFLVLRAGIAYRKGDVETGINLLNKAMYSTNSEDRKEKIMNLIEMVESGTEELRFD